MIKVEQLIESEWIEISSHSIMEDAQFQKEMMIASGIPAEELRIV